MRAFLRRLEFRLGFASLLVIAGFFLWQAADGEVGTAVVSINGERAYTFDLRACPDQTVGLREDWGLPVELEIKDHRIRFVRVTCPDHICEKAGFISKPGQTAVCMPNRVIVAVE